MDEGGVEFALSEKEPAEGVVGFGAGGSEFDDFFEGGAGGLDVAGLEGGDAFGVEGVGVVGGWFLGSGGG